MASRKGRKGMQRGGQERRHAEAAGSSCVSSPSSCMSDFQIESGPCRTPLEGEWRANVQANVPLGRCRRKTSKTRLAGRLALPISHGPLNLNQNFSRFAFLRVPLRDAFLLPLRVRPLPVTVTYST